MAYKDYLVDISQQKVSYKKAKSGAKYVYYHLRYYRNKNNTPTRNEVFIGKTSLNENGKMHPNERYFEIFPEEKTEKKENLPSTITQAGATMFLSLVS